MVLAELFTPSVYLCLYLFILSSFLQLCIMASADVKMPEISEVVIVTVSDEQSVAEEDKALLVAAQLSHQPGFVRTL